jgi:uncharacterized protein
MAATQREVRKVPWWVLILITVGYSLILDVLDRVWPFEFAKASYDADTILIAAGHIMVCAAYVTIVALALGWWQDAWHDFLPMRKWMWILPGAMFTIAFCQTNFFAFAPLGVKYLLAAAWLSIAVGYSEEMLVRGILLTGFRQLVSERWAFLWATLLFGAMHIGNMLGGQSLKDTLVQIAGATMLGTALYATRRLSGGLILGMALHAFWDFSGDINMASQRINVGNLSIFAFVAGLGILLLYPVCLAGFVAILAGWTEPKKPNTPAPAVAAD